MDEQKEDLNRKLDINFEDLNREIKEQIHHFEAKVERSLGSCEQRSNEIRGVSLTASLSQGCVEGRLTVIR